MKLSTAEIYRQKESSSLIQTAKYIFNRLLDNCEVLELGALLKDIKTGKTPSKNEKRYYEDEFIDWFKPNEIGDKKYLEQAESKLSRYAYEKGQVTVYKQNSILINAIGDVGRIAILNHEASSNQQITAIELNESQLLTEYCYYYLLSNRHHFYKDLFQTTLPIVNQKKIKLIPIPVPKINEQKRIVTFLNKLENVKTIVELKDIRGFDDFIGVAEKFYILKDKNVVISTELTHQLSLVKQLRQAFLREAMQGKLVEQNEADEPATELLAKIKAEKEKLIAEKKIKKPKPIPLIEKNEIPFEIPDSWVWCRLNDACIKITDGTHHSPVNTHSGEYMYVTAKNIKDNGIDLSNITYVSKSVHDEIYSRCDPEFGDILYIKDGATTGIVTINNLTTPFSLLSSVALLKLNENVFNKFLMYVMRSPVYYDATRNNMYGVALTRVTLTKINNSIIPLPPLSEQKRIVAKLDELMAYCDSLEESIKNSQAQNEMLLAQVLREALEPKEKEVVG